MSLHSVNYINRTCSTLSALVDKCNEAALNNDSKKIIKNFNDFSSLWEKSKKFFSLLIHEENINELDLEFENIKTHLSNDDLSELENSIQLFKEKLFQICENEKIIIENIL